MICLNGRLLRELEAFTSFLKKLDLIINSILAIGQIWSVIYENKEQYQRVLKLGEYNLGVLYLSKAKAINHDLTLHPLVTDTYCEKLHTMCLSD